MKERLAFYRHLFLERPIFNKKMRPHRPTHLAFFRSMLVVANLILVFSCGVSSKAQSNQTHQQPTAFWEKFSSSIMAGLREEKSADARTAILIEGKRLVKANQSDRFACGAMYRLGMEFHRQGSFAEALECFDKALQLTETQSGDHLCAWNMIAECHKATKDYAAAIIACDAVLKCDGPDIMKYDLYQAALTRKADLLLQSTNASVSDRRAAEALLEPLTEIKNSGPFSEKQGQLIRARIQNLKKLGEVQQAYEIGEYFIQKNPSDPYTPLICADLCMLTNHYASTAKLEFWVNFLSTNQVPNSAALANLKLDLMNAYARDGKFEQSVKIGKELADFKKAAGDPVPWGKDHLESVANVTKISQGQVERESRMGFHPETSERMKTRRIIVLSFISLSLLAFLAFFLKSRKSVK